MRPLASGPVALLALSLAGPVARAAPGDPQPVERYALLVGHNDGGAGRVTLRYAHDDAEQMATVLTELGGVSSSHEWVLLDPSVTALDAAFGEVREALDASRGRAEFVFYYSGHSDEEGLLMGEARVPYRDLRQRLDGLPARVRLAILDSCASGALILSKGGRQVAPFLMDESTQVDGFAYLTSSSADEVAQEAERIGGSYFTHYLASGLRGAADTSGDGRVTLNEAYAYANEETLAQTERTQHGPQHARYETQLSGTGEFVLTDLALTSASLVLDAQLAGRALIRDENGALVVELTKVAGRAIEVGLAEGQYTVTFVRDTVQHGEAVVSVAAGVSTLLSPDEVTWSASEATVARGDVGAGLGLPSPELPPVAAVTPAVADPGEAPSYWFRAVVAPGVPDAAPGVDRMLLGLVGARGEEIGGAGLAPLFVETEGRTAGLATALGWTTAGSLNGVQIALGFAAVREAGGVGIQSALGGTVAGESLDGVQGSVGFNVAGGTVRGAQLTTGFNGARGGLRGAQASVVANWAGAPDDGERGFGGQLSAGANVVSGRFDGPQVTTALNLATGELRGAQLAAALNLASGGMRGLQLASVNVIGGQASKGFQLGGVNVATALDGVQLSIVNYGGNVDGAQIGLVNVAGDVDGTQIGLVNIAHHVKGVPVGLLSFEKDGRHDVLVYGSETDALNLDLKFGGDYVFTLLGGGAMPTVGGRVGHGYVSFGLGAHLPMHKLWLDLDALGATYIALGTTTVAGGEVTGPFADPPTPVGRARATVGLQLLPQLAPFAGVSVNVRVPTGSAQIDPAPEFISGPDRDTVLWPGLFAGVAF